VKENLSKDMEESRRGIRGSYDLPNGWKWVRLDVVAWLNKEKRDPRKEMPNEEFLYIDISSIEEETGRILEVKKILGKNAPSRARRVIHTNDVIMSTVRPYLKSIAIIPEEYDNQICSTGFAVLTCKKEILPKYLFYLLFSGVVIRQCNEMMVGAHYPALRFDQVARIKIPLPPLEEQKRIVSRLEQLVSRAEEAKRLRKLAKEEAEKMIQATLNKVFSKAEEKWGLVKLTEMCKINPSKNEIKHLSDDTQVTFVPMTAVNEITGEIEKPEIRLLGEVKKGYTYFREGDILFAKITPCMENGKSVIAKHLVNGIGFGSTEFHVLRPIKGKAIPEWIHFYIRQKTFRTEAARNMTGSVGQQRVPVYFLKSVKIPFAPIEEQKKLVSYLSGIKSFEISIDKLQQKTEDELEKLIPSILYKAFRGEL